jgi:hypothetical protein
MYIDEKKIIKDTKSVFFKSQIQQEKYNNIQDWVSEEDYKTIHTSPLVPLDLTFDYTNLKTDLLPFINYAEQWGGQHTYMPRLGLALVNQDGILKKNDPVNGSLYEWNLNNPEHPLLETDCTSPTTVLNVSSLKNLKIFDRHWCRSNILIWRKGAKFLPHIDTILPAPWLRLWATDNKSIALYFTKNNKLIQITNIELGRIYLIDTSIVHSASCIGDEGIQLFLSVLPDAYNIIKNLICR